MTRHPIIEKKIASKSHKKASSHNAHGANGMQKDHANFNRSKKTRLFENKNANIGLGAVAMGLAGVATFLLLNTKKKSRNLKKDFYNSFNDFKEEAEGLAHDAYEKGRRAYDLASDYARNVRETAHDAMEEPYSRNLLIAGTIGGTILGASLVYLLNRNHNEEPTDFFGKAAHVFDSIKEAASSASENVRSADWLEAAKEVLDAVAESIHEEGEHNSSHSRAHVNPLNIQQAIELGLSGYRFWQNLKRKRK